MESCISSKMGEHVFLVVCENGVNVERLVHQGTSPQSLLEDAQ